jgi:KDO2-lipid IV(A) lauroyltransferase
MDLPPARLFGPRYWPTWIGLGLLRLIERLPFPVILAIGRTLGRLVYRLPLPYRRIVRTNIALCLPELSLSARERLAQRHFEALGISVFESAMAWWSSAERIQRLSSIQGLDHLEAALARGRGVILLTAHFTTLTIGASIINHRVPIDPLYRPLKNELLARVSGNSFRRHAHRTIQHDDIRTMITALKRNEIVWYASDQSYRKKGAAMVPFFGVPCATNVFTPRLAELTGATVLYYETERLPGTAGWRGIIKPAFTHWPSGDPTRDTLEYHQQIEAQVRRIPEQYWWIHRRFKGLAPTDPDHYAR